jgi:hypothetical protein
MKTLQRQGYRLNLQLTSLFITYRSAGKKTLRGQSDLYPFLIDSEWSHFDLSKKKIDVVYLQRPPPPLCSVGNCSLFYSPQRQQYTVEYQTEKVEKNVQ